MTLEQLLDSDAATLERMTDVELEEFFRPYFPTTRPDLAAIKRTSEAVTKKKKMGGGGLGAALALEFLAKQGITLSGGKKK